MSACPRCTFPLEVARHDTVELDHCGRCGGTFLDAGEETELFGHFVGMQTWKDSNLARKRRDSALRCPRDQASMDSFAIEFDAQRVDVDVCPECAGVWFDSGEGKLLREVIMEAGQIDTEEGPGLAARRGAGSYLLQLLSGFPLEVWNPIRRTPVLTYMLIGVLVVVYALQTASVAIYGYDVLFNFSLVPGQILNGRELWTIVTSMFLHLGFIHLAGNVYFLYLFGDNVEDYLGPRRFLALYFASGVAGSLLQILLQRDPSIGVAGASGAISGLMGAYLVLFPRVRLYQILYLYRFKIRAIWYLGIWLAFNLLMALLDAPGVAWFAHIGGFGAGALIGWRFRPRTIAEALAGPA